MPKCTSKTKQSKVRGVKTSKPIQPEKPRPGEMVVHPFEQGGGDVCSFG